MENNIIETNYVTVWEPIEFCKNMVGKDTMFIPVSKIVIDVIKRELDKYSKSDIIEPYDIYIDVITGEPILDGYNIDGYLKITVNEISSLKKIYDTEDAKLINYTVYYEENNDSGVSYKLYNSILTRKPFGYQKSIMGNIAKLFITDDKLHEYVFFNKVDKTTYSIPKHYKDDNSTLFPVIQVGSILQALGDKVDNIEEYMLILYKLMYTVFCKPLEHPEGSVTDSISRILIPDMVKPLGGKIAKYYYICKAYNNPNSECYIVMVKEDNTSINVGMVRGIEKLYNVLKDKDLENVNLSIDIY